MAELNLVVLRATDVKASVRFYERLGVEFEQERHGAGPVHFAAVIGGVVFEVYPAGDGEPSGGIRVGFRVPDVDTVVESFGADVVVTGPADSPWGRRAVLRDPDGVRVELLQPGSGERG